MLKKRIAFVPAVCFILFAPWVLIAEDINIQVRFFKGEWSEDIVLKREMICKVYEIDPLLCPHYGAEMKVIAFIEDHKVIDNIIDYLKLRFQAERPPPPQVVQQELLMAASPR